MNQRQKQRKINSDDWDLKSTAEGLDGVVMRSLWSITTLVELSQVRDRRPMIRTYLSYHTYENTFSLCRSHTALVLVPVSRTQLYR